MKKLSNGYHIVGSFTFLLLTFSVNPKQRELDEQKKLNKTESVFPLTRRVSFFLSRNFEKGEGGP